MTTEHNENDPGVGVFEEHPIAFTAAIFLGAIPVFTLLIFIAGTPLFEALKFAILFALAAASMPVFALLPHVVIAVGSLVYGVWESR